MGNKGIGLIEILILLLDIAAIIVSLATGHYLGAGLILIVTIMLIAGIAKGMK